VTGNQRRLNRTASNASRGTLGWAIRVAGVVILLQFVFFGLLVVSQGLPDGPIVSRLAEDVREGAYGPPRMPDRMGGIGDTFTECVVVGTGLGPAPGESILHQAGRMPRLSNCEKGAEQILALESGTAVQDSSYFRYWAGYSVLVRPVLAVAGIEGVRIVTGALLAASMVFAGSVLSRLTRWWVPVVLFGPLLLSSNLMSTPSTSLLSALTWSVTIAGVGFTALAARRSESAACLAVAVSAAVYGYVDLLTNPAAAWSLTAMAAGVTHWWVRREVRSTFWLVVAAGVIWIVSFTFTWVARWLWAVPFVGLEEVVTTVRENVAFRTAGEYVTVDPRFGQGLVRNVSWWLTNVPTTAPMLVLTTLAVGVGAIVTLRKRQSGAGRGGLTLALAALPIPLWLIIVSNHSQIHAFLTFRLIPTSLGIILLSVAVAAFGPSPLTRTSPKSRGGEPRATNAVAASSVGAA